MTFVALCKVCLRCSCQKSTVEIEMPCLSCLSACLQGAGLTVALSLVSFRRGCLEGHHEVRSGVKRATQPLQVFRLRQRAASHPAMTGHYYSCPWGQDLPMKGLSFY